MRLSQSSFGEDFTNALPAITLDETITPEYLNFGHGAAPNDGKALAFFTASFVSRDGRFIGARPLDLLKRYGSVPPVDNVGIPQEDVGTLGSIIPKEAPEEGRGAL